MQQLQSCRPATGVQHAAHPHVVLTAAGARRTHRRCSLLPSATASSGPSSRPRLVLGIESSCDDTGVAVVSSDGRVLGEALATQAEIHAPWGGVVPNLAMEAHKAAIDRVVDEALQKANITPDQLDAVAVTVGPGLALCLRVGALKAFQLSAAHQLPLVKVHHMEAHALVARLMPDETQRPTFPFLCLLVSGGHNLLLLVRGVGDYVQLGTTLDDALGEAYDKVARLLGLDLRPSGGAALEAAARHGDPLAYKFVVPMRKYANCDFSYAGLKTSTRLAITAHLGETADRPQISTATGAQGVPTQADLGSASAVSQTSEEAARRDKVRADIAASFQHVATVHLVDRVQRAISWARETEPGVRHLVVAGGVACNQHIRAQLSAVAEKAGVELVLPPPRWCTDNGVMVAWAGQERLSLGLHEPPYQPVTPDAEVAEDTWIDLWPRWPLTSEQHPKCQAAVAQTPNIKPETVAGYGKRSARKARLQTSLTEMTTAQLAQLAASAQGHHLNTDQQQTVAAH